MFVHFGIPVTFKTILILDHTKHSNSIIFNSTIKVVMRIELLPILPVVTGCPAGNTLQSGVYRLDKDLKSPDL